MLEIVQREASWKPTELSHEQIEQIIHKHLNPKKEQKEWLIVFQVVPYIDSFYVYYDEYNVKSPGYVKRFTFCDDYAWSFWDEQFFIKNCVENKGCAFDYGCMDEIFKYYSSEKPDWHLQRYYTKSLRLLDHIYHCMRKNTVKEILYKSGLDELAAKADLIDEVDLLSTKPADLYEGVSMRSLKALNCKEGVELLLNRDYRVLIKGLQKRFPTLFKDKLNDAQCRYMKRLIDGELTVDEVGRLFMARKGDLSKIWCHSLYEVFIQKEQIEMEIEEVKRIDPIYKEFINKECREAVRENGIVNQLVYYLLRNREVYDKRIRVANRNRNYEWQERNADYIVRYPQTINDYCREAVYMRNCLITYVEAVVHNDTTIMFMRKADNSNTPYITLEVYKNRLMQAYHRFNEKCTEDEMEWIEKYCTRHGIWMDEGMNGEDIEQA